MNDEELGMYVVFIHLDYTKDFIDNHKNFVGSMKEYVLSENLFMKDIDTEEASNILMRYASIYNL